MGEGGGTGADGGVRTGHSGKQKMPQGYYLSWFLGALPLVIVAVLFCALPRSGFHTPLWAWIVLPLIGAFFGGICGQVFYAWAYLEKRGM